MSTPATRAELSREAIHWVERMHSMVDALVEPIAAAHATRLQCRSGCNGCCSDALSVFEIEAQVIERHHAELLATGTPNTQGGCAFLDEQGGCRIYESRPYVCRTQGLPLRWLELDERDTPTELRDICPLNAEGPALDTLPAAACWTIGPIEERLAARQSALDGGAGARVPLRGLFAASRRHLPLAQG